MTMRSLIEPFEGRRLMAATTPFTPDDPTPITINRHGVVTVQGTANDDSFNIETQDSQTYVTIGSTRPTQPEDKTLIVNGQYLKRTLANERKAGANPISPVSLSQAFPLGTVRSVVVNGAAGNDYIQLDTATQAFTFRRGIEETNLIIHPKTLSTVGGVRVLHDVFVEPVAGQYGSKMSAWLKRSADQIAAAVKHKKTAGVAFLGDSLTQRLLMTGAASYAANFGSLRPLDLGLTGDTTSQMLYRIRYQGLLDGIKAKAIVLEIGTNNITLSDNPDSTASGVAAVVNEIRTRLPDAKIVLASVLPRPDPFDNRVVNKVNDRLALLADGDHIQFVNATDTFSSTRAKAKYFIPGDIHLTPNGYKVWTGLLLTAVQSVLDS